MHMATVTATAKAATAAAAAPQLHAPPARPSIMQSNAVATQFVQQQSQTVATQFVQQFYHVLSNWPENLHRFYTDASTLSHTVVGSETTRIHTQRGIHEKVMSLGLQGAIPQIFSVDAQTSIADGVVVHTTGSLTLKGETKPKPFAQVFFLARQEIGYFVLNDLFCWLPEPKGDEEKVVVEAVVQPKEIAKEKAPAAQPAKMEEAPAAAAPTSESSEAEKEEEKVKENRGEEGSLAAPAMAPPMTYAQRAAAAAKRFAVQGRAKESEVLSPKNWGGEEEEKKPSIIKKKKDKGRGRGRRSNGKDRNQDVQTK